MKFACLKLCCLAILTFARSAAAQDEDAAAISGWVALDAPTGHEHLATAAVQDMYPGWEQTRYGNLVKVVGQGEPRRTIACALDAFSYAVSQITDDGYLRLHRIGGGSRHSLWDQAHSGQHLRILTRSGPVVGVTAIANGHFASQHRNDISIITQDDLWLDVGAESAADVAVMGIGLLDPVLRHIPAWNFADEAAGPRSGARAGCAALVAAAEAGINGSEGSTRYVLSVQQVFGWIGLGADLSRNPAPDQLVVLGPGEAEFRDDEVTEVPGRANSVLPEQTRVRWIVPDVSDPEALMERVSADSANRMLAALVRAIDPDADVPAWQPAPARTSVRNHDSSQRGADDPAGLAEVEAILDGFAELSAVPGKELPVRELVYSQLPQWARDEAQTDETGNLWIEFGGEGELTVFVAHMDEVGYEVESITPEGVVSLNRLGGVVTPAWEGQPALLQLDGYTDGGMPGLSGQLKGVFLARGEPRQRQPDTVLAWFGMNRDALEQAGVRPGLGITGYKEGHRMGPFRYASRGLDDRVGTTALLLALQQIDPAEIGHRVMFAWSVREEGGLVGAGELARKFGNRTRRVYSIDTFVSSDTPLESPHFAWAPLGDGPVLRSIENSAMATPYELDRNRRVAESAGIDYQYGLTQGSTDGATFTPYGAPNAGLSWPGRYSHSPAEIADLRDISGLVSLIRAMAEAPEEP